MTKVTLNNRQFNVAASGVITRCAFIDIRGRCFEDKEVSPNVHRSGYAYFNVVGKAFYVSRVIAHAHLGMPIDSPMDVDHISGNKLDNSVSNLRVVTRSENCCGFKAPAVSHSSNYRGVSKKKNGKFLARFRHMKERTFDGEIDAANWWDAQSKAYGYPSESLNFPSGLMHCQSQ